MIIVSDSARALKSFLSISGLHAVAQAMLLRVVLAFIMHRGRMSCSAAAGSIASEPIHRGVLTRFMAQPRWQRFNFNLPFANMLLAKEKQRGKFLFIIDATLVSQAGQKTENTYSTGNRKRRSIKKGFRYNKKTVTVITESGEHWNVAPGLLRRVDSSQSANHASANVIQLPRK